MAERAFTDADQVAADNLRRIWNEKAGALKLTQLKVGQSFPSRDGGGITQGAVSQYINGGMALNAMATIIFAGHLQVQPTDIRPDFPQMVWDMDPESFRIAKRYQSADDDQRRKIDAALTIAGV